jgi:hypothetical protein
MATVQSNQVTVNVVSPTSTTGSYCTTGMYITIYGSSTTPGSGKSYQYNYEWGPPSGYHEVSAPNFCIYYEGGAAPTGCYCNFSSNSSNNVFGSFYTNGQGGWWAFLIILSTNYQFSIGWQE